MSNYSQVTSFTPKDSLPSGNPSKVIMGADFDGEFNAISVAVASKADTTTVSTLTTTVSNLSTTVDGKVAGPASATDNTLPRFDSTTGKLVQGSGVVVDDSNNVSTPGSVLSTGGFVGYGVGAGGTVTQITSKVTAVTLNKLSGTITMHNAALASGSQVSFAMNNTFIAAQGNVLVASIDVDSIAALGYALDLATGGGAAYFTLTNNTGAPRTDAVRINFAIVKGSTT